MTTHSTPIRIRRTLAASKSIKSIGYHPDSQTLELEFTSGGVYRYADVSPETFETFRTAASVGRHFQTHIRPHYTATKHPVGNIE